MSIGQLLGEMARQDELGVEEVDDPYGNVIGLKSRGLRVARASPSSRRRCRVFSASTTVSGPTSVTRAGCGQSYLINSLRSTVLSPVEPEVVASALSLMTVRHFSPSPREGGWGEGVGLVKRQRTASPASISSGK